MSVFFRNEELRDAWASLAKSEQSLLNNDDSGPRCPEFLRVAFRQPPAVSNWVSGLARAIHRHDLEYVREQARFLLLGGLWENVDLAPRQALSTLRRTTREELIARILRAKTLVDDSRGQVSALDQLAFEACLSRFHFLRVFTEVIGETPSAYARRQRLQTAAISLAAGKDPRRVIQVAGYKNRRSFVKAFRRVTGSEPPMPMG